MSLNIKNDEAISLARQLAAATGENLTQAVTVAVRERLARVTSKQDAEVADRAARIRQIARDASMRWVEPHRSADHGALLYDDLGVPR